MLDGFSFYFSCLQKISGDKTRPEGTKNPKQKLIALQPISLFGMVLSLLNIIFLAFFYVFYSKRK